MGSCHSHQSVKHSISPSPSRNSESSQAPRPTHQPNGDCRNNLGLNSNNLQKLNPPDINLAIRNNEERDVYRSFRSVSATLEYRGCHSPLSELSPPGGPISDYIHNKLANSEAAKYARNQIGVQGMPPPGTTEANYACSVRLRRLVPMIESKEISTEDLVINLEYTVKVLESLYNDDVRYLKSRVSEADNALVPEEVRDWLTSTFTDSQADIKTVDRKPNFRSVANAIRVGIIVEKVCKRRVTEEMNVPDSVKVVIKEHLNTWCFDIFKFSEISGNHSLKYMAYELMMKYDLIMRFKVPVNTLEAFLNHLAAGYDRHGNTYHNQCHAADVAQTCHYLIHSSNISLWLSDLEIFATLFSALIHDFEHTGTTNNFHINSKSELAMLYNDKGVLENHHVSSAFRLLKRGDLNILSGLSRDEYRTFRSLCVTMVLNTDMTLHFQQIKVMKNMILLPLDKIEKPAALSLLLHCADIAHPGKGWYLHEKWTNLLLEEFFKQGDLESQMKLPFSPLCDRKSTLVAQSQIGFIEFIVEPSLYLLGEMIDAIVRPITGARPTTVKRSNSDTGLTLLENGLPTDKTGYVRPWTKSLIENKLHWRKRAETEIPGSHMTASRNIGKPTSPLNYSNDGLTKEDSHNNTHNPQTS